MRSPDETVDIIESEIRTNFGSFLLLGRIEDKADAKPVFYRIIKITKDFIRELGDRFLISRLGCHDGF